MREALEAPRPRWPIRVLGVAAAACAALGGVEELSAAFEPASAVAEERVVAPELGPVLERFQPAIPRLELAPLTPKLRKRGYHECYMPDPLKWGPYARPRNLSMGRIAIPQRGGHTADMGFDVLVHFHGADPLRKFLVQVARGVVLVGIDRGVGSGHYMKAFETPTVFPTLLRSIEKALRRHTGDARAHIRHLGLSAWSAGYGAVNEILERRGHRVEAVVLLDSLHAGWSHGKPSGPRQRTVKHVSGAYVAATLDFARRARDGEKTFILTHSDVDPIDYPSVRLTADYLLAGLGLQRQPVQRDLGLLTQKSTVDVGGLHVWAFGGRNERTHCAHLSLISDVLQDVLEKQWDTPAMDRSMLEE
ncbi:hypothetical protein ACFL5O_09840 [Myxococcota bacterium]